MRKTQLFLVVVAAGLLASGCATKEYVEGEVGAVHTRVDTVEGQVEENQTTLRQHDERIEEASDTAKEALERAKEAGKLAEGKLLYETVLTDADVQFGFDKTKLSDEAKAALDDFAQPLVEGNENVYVEIQGHTDSVGTEEYNEELGLERAEAVRLYLNKEHGIPLHRMSVISYGESSPTADNNTREGRAQNRRVVLVVLK
ncbi:MAG: OmpA family protein [Thermoanaerobaculia bacterium]|nr:OmpA family protein [Thermoanaerobaculia bacterium]